MIERTNEQANGTNEMARRGKIEEENRCRCVRVCAEEKCEKWHSSHSRRTVPDCFTYTRTLCVLVWVYDVNVYVCMHEVFGCVCVRASRTCSQFFFQQWRVLLGYWIYFNILYLYIYIILVFIFASGKSLHKCTQASERTPVCVFLCCVFLRGVWVSEWMCTLQIINIARCKLVHERHVGVRDRSLPRSLSPSIFWCNRCKRKCRNKLLLPSIYAFA